MEVKTENVVVKVSDETEMMLFVARPALDRAPGLLLLQEAFGVNAHIRDVGKRLAREGYLVVAPELFHRTAPRGFEGAYDNLKGMMPHLQCLTQPGMKLDLTAAYQWLKNDSQVFPDRIGSIGFCMGGRASYIANSTLPLRAAISFYGGGIAPDLLPLAQSQHGPLLFFWGGMDRHISTENRAAITQALDHSRKNYTTVVFSDADHAFFCDARNSYQPRAAEQAWALSLAFLKSNI